MKSNKKLFVNSVDYILFYNKLKQDLIEHLNFHGLMRVLNNKLLYQYRF